MKTFKKIVSLVLVTCLMGGLLISISGCGLATRTAGKVDGEDIPAGMYIYFLRSAIYELEQRYQYGELSSEYSSESSEDKSSAEEKSSEEEKSSAEASSSASSASSAASSATSSASSEDKKPATLWDAIVNNKPAKDYVIDEAFKNCARVLLMEKKAEEYKIVLDNKDQAEIDKIYDNNGGKLRLEEDLNEAGVSIESYDRIIKADIIREHIKDKLFGLEGETPLSKEALKKEYDENYRRVKHILFKTDDLKDKKDKDGKVTATVAQQKAEIEKKYEEVLAKAKKTDDFEALVKEYSDDSMDAEVGYVFKKGQMVEPFEKAAWDLPVGKIATCESQFGWHIIKAYDPYEKEQYMNDALKGFVDNYKNEKYQKVEGEWLEKIEVNRSGAAMRRYKPSKIYKDNNIASNVSAQIEYYNSYYSNMMANQDKQ